MNNEPEWNISIEEQKRRGMFSKNELEILKDNPHAFDEDLGGYLVHHEEKPRFEQYEWP